jgi:MurNAc alpha-1-phosphate uridylyltransferase
VNNPDHHPDGDFILTPKGLIMHKHSLDTYTLDQEPVQAVAASASPKVGTFAGIGVYHPKLFDGVVAGQPAKLAPLLREAMLTHKVLGSWYDGVWVDVGTPQRLERLDQQLVSENSPRK